MRWHANPTIQQDRNDSDFARRRWGSRTGRPSTNRSRGLAARAPFGLIPSSSWGWILVTLLVGLVASASFAQPVPPIPPVPVPPANPITPEKAVLGKILFWDQQLSSDQTVACGTCHLTEFGGGDPVLGAHPGADGFFGTPDDVNGSLGVVHRDVQGVAVNDPIFGFGRQVTDRSSPNFFGGLWDPESFWDGRASSAFDDPITGVNLIPIGGTLESQSIAPILNSIEMARDGRTWTSVTTRLAGVKPLALASALPADVVTALATSPSYPDLFIAAFGTADITPARIGFAIATYERTLVADQTPWDAFMKGSGTALTPNQQDGWNFFQTSPCATCHAPPLFSTPRFESVGLRDVNDDIGRAVVTGAPTDRGLFKVPTLRNAALKVGVMHTGEFSTMLDVVRFYQPAGLHFPTNLSPQIPILIPPTAEAPLVDFLENGLIDPRVAAGLAPFDRPILAVPEPVRVELLAVGALALSMLEGLRARRRRPVVF